MPISPQQSQQLQQITQLKLKKMFDDKKQTPKLLIPKNLPQFVKSKNYVNFLESVYEYCMRFSEIMKQYQGLQEKMANRSYGQISLLQKQKQQLGKLQRQISYQYAVIIIEFNSQCLSETGRRSNFKDQVFFEALIYLVQKVIKQQFTREQFHLVQEQINRLFRTNRYNLIKKRHQNDQVLHKYPALKQQKQKNKNNLTSILNHAPQRISAYKKYEKQKRVNSTHDYTETMGIPKQLSNPDMEQRSPLLCTWLPSKKTMVQDFTQSSNKYNYLQGVNKRTTFQTISSATSEGGIEGRSRMASLGNNVITSYNYSAKN